MAVKWLNNSIPLLTHFTLCTSEEEFLKLSKRLKIEEPWLADGLGAACVRLHSLSGRPPCCIVCIELTDDFLHAYSMLVHEAVHVWQTAREWLGETSPGEEFEAYAIQHIATQLISDYKKQKAKK